MSLLKFLMRFIPEEVSKGLVDIIYQIVGSCSVTTDCFMRYL